MKFRNGDRVVSTYWSVEDVLITGTIKEINHSRNGRAAGNEWLHLVEWDNLPDHQLKTHHPMFLRLLTPLEKLL